MTSCTNAQSATRTSLRISLETIMLTPVAQSATRTSLRISLGTIMLTPVVLEAVNNEYTCGLAANYYTTIKTSVDYVTHCYGSLSNWW